MLTICFAVLELLTIKKNYTNSVYMFTYSHKRGLRKLFIFYAIRDTIYIRFNILIVSIFFFFL